jgi:ornithine carbamoyltransferase
MPAAGTLLSVSDLTEVDLRHLTVRACWFASEEAGGHRPLSGRVVGSYFRATSTRTRTAFASAALRLGAGHIAFGHDDLQLNTGETLEDTARVFSLMLDALVVRTAADPAEVRALTTQDAMPVINAMTSDEHPTQALADLATLQMYFGRVDGLRVLYVGEGNNTAAALALALSRFTDMELVFCTPPGYGLSARILAASAGQAAEAKSSIAETHDVGAVGPGFDVIYTTRWQTTGTTKPDPQWREVFDPFQVDGGLMGRQPGAVFMHDLPAHREQEVTASVLDGPRSIAFRQAAMKMYSAMAVLEWSVTGRRNGA